MKHIRGVYAIEFSIVASVFFLVLFSAIEVGRLLYTYNVLHEAARRAARIAVVCQVSSDIHSQALFNGANLVPNLTNDNLIISYLRLDGTVIEDLVNDRGFIRLVRAEVTNYQHQFLVPGLTQTLNSPTFSATLPRESLGVFKGGTSDCS
ncbi:TadE family protein [Shewanella halifaxensis HAW-EB4]|uniref:TadE family protein n=1 Tax=Shewanella halifaxensis (strain HAW-EB4) TaxID=458817 RepID=B0TVF1_SHEHH|nr:TadE/TadG family type IV pilus assembly protein [Shewanella halifaxensis]ABZ76836.1 TadE family protein [Shewanella halifaxensis HAW-EB4]